MIRRKIIPRLSLYKPERGKDYTFIDGRIEEMFTIGGTDVFLHKYLGPENPSEEDATADKPRYDSVAETNIQDLLFLENRDRKYDEDIYRIRGVYNVQDVDFDLSQFGLFLANDTLFMTVHINASVRTVGRKIISGDVIELPHLKDEYALNDLSVALKRFYVVEDVNRASEGFSPTWYPHLYRLKLKQIVDSQEYKEILDLPMDEDNPGEGTLRDMLSTYAQERDINEAVVNQAEADAPRSGYDISHYFSLQTNSDGNVEVEESDASTVPEMKTPVRAGYDGYMISDDNPPNGSQFGHGISFPTVAEEGDYFLRTDFAPKRLFRYDGNKWVKVHDSVRMTLTNGSDRLHQKGTFVNNNEFVFTGLEFRDTVSLSEGDTVIETDIDYPVSSPYVSLKFREIRKSYALADHPNLITENDESSKVVIQLPVIDSAQDTVPYTGIWDVEFYADREASRQSLSQVLRPRADN